MYNLICRPTHEVNDWDERTFVDSGILWYLVAPHYIVVGYLVTNQGNGAADSRYYISINISKVNLLSGCLCSIIYYLNINSSIQLVHAGN